MPYDPFARGRFSVASVWTEPRHNRAPVERGLPLFDWQLSGAREVA